VEHITLKPEMSSAKKQPDGPRPLEVVSKEASRAAETIRIRQALQSTSGNKTRAAEQLGVSYKTLLTKIKEYEIK
jgi:DNA-binding NtrC family response regulator